MFDTVAGLEALIDEVRSVAVAADDGERVDQIRLLEQLRSVVAAVQARVTASLVASQQAGQRAAGVPEDRVGRGVAAQVAFARRISPFQAQRYVACVTRWTTDLPATYAALREGRVSEWRATIIARETGWLSVEHRGAVDETLAPRLEGWGDRQVERETRRVGYRLDPAGYVHRIGRAAADRRVTTRPAPDLMCRVSALLPVAQGVAVYAALKAHADTRRAAGDLRTSGQLMADTLVERATGQATAGDVPVEVNLILTDTALFHAGTNGSDPADDPHEPAHLAGYGPVPATLARQLLHRPSADTVMWLRRLYRDPGTGELVSMETRRRRFTPAQRRFIAVRDQTCRTPWCDAAIRHTDHVTAHEHGGPTRLDNGQGICEACNYAKAAPGWYAKTADHGAVTTTTPTGHQYTSHPPDPPGARPTRQRAREGGGTE